MKSGGRQPRIPDITLEQYLLGELPENEMLATKQMIDDDEESRARLAALKRSNQEILKQYPPSFMSRLIHSRLERHEPKSRNLLSLPRKMTAFIGAAAALVLLFIVLPYDFISWAPGTDASLERVKGQGPHLKLYRKTPDGSEALEDGTRVFRGDIVRIGYQAAGRAYGVIMSVDGRGTVTLHLPDQGNQSASLENDGQILLDFALELDDAPRWERFYFITSDASFDVAPVLRAARQIDIKGPVDRAEKLVLPKGLDQFVVTLEKGST